MCSFSSILLPSISVDPREVPSSVLGGRSRNQIKEVSSSLKESEMVVGRPFSLI